MVLTCDCVCWAAVCSFSVILLCDFFSCGHWPPLFCFFQTPSEPWSSSSSTEPNLTTDSRTRARPSKASWSKTSSCISPWTESLTSSRVSSSTLCSVRIRFTLAPSDCSYTSLFFFFWSMLIRSNLSAGQLIERIAVLLGLNLPHLFSSEKIWQAASCFCFGERMFKKGAIFQMYFWIKLRIKQRVFCEVWTVYLGWICHRALQYKYTTHTGAFVQIPKKLFLADYYKTATPLALPSKPSHMLTTHERPPDNGYPNTKARPCGGLTQTTQVLL